MQKLRIVPDSRELSDHDEPISTAAGTADKTDCMMTYLRSLERDAEALHGDDDDWRYGRYLVHKAIVEAVQSAARQSASD